MDQVFIISRQQAGQDIDNTPGVLNFHLTSVTAVDLQKLFSCVDLNDGSQAVSEAKVNANEDLFLLYGSLGMSMQILALALITRKAAN